MATEYGTGVAADQARSQGRLRLQPGGFYPSGYKGVNR